jgi:hypothetical protein
MGGSVIAALHKNAGLPVAPELLARLQQQQQQRQQQEGGRAQGRVAAEALQQLLSKDQVCAIVSLNFVLLCEMCYAIISDRWEKAGRRNCW